MSGKDNTAKIDNSLGTNHLVVRCDVDNSILTLGFELVSPGNRLMSSEV